jgi:hypothetical protein
VKTIKLTQAFQRPADAFQVYTIAHDARSRGHAHVAENEYGLRAAKPCQVNLKVTSTAPMTE